MTERADRLAVAAGLARSRTEAQRLIEAGHITLAGAAGDTPLKPASRLPDGTRLVRRDDGDRHVSRGGLKLEAALRAFAVPVAGRLAADLGQSTGGFTEVLLRRAAARVIGVEVGHGQLDAGLAADDRVVTLERTHVRDVDRALLSSALLTHGPRPEPSPAADAARTGSATGTPAAGPASADAAAEAARIVERGFDLVVVDLSFISQRRVLGPIAALLAPDADLVSLVKPQFELGPGAVDRRGIVRDTAAREGLRELFERALPGHGLKLCGWIDSPISGGDGNHEYLMHARRAEQEETP